MLTATSSDFEVTSKPIIKVSGKQILVEVKGSDGPTKLKLYASHPLTMYYILFCCPKKSKHRVAGSMNVSAFTFDDSSKAYANVRLNVLAIKANPFINDKNEVVKQTEIVVDIHEDDEEKEYLKIQLILLRYAWENYDNPKKVNPGFGESFNEKAYDTLTEAMIEMYEWLEDTNICQKKRCPAVKNESVVEHKKVGGRPSIKRKAPTFSKNIDVKNKDWVKDCGDLMQLQDDTLAFHASFFL